MRAAVRSAEGLSRAERRKRATRERLLDAALRVFLARGFDAATTGEITAVAELGAGTFYLHFRDKRDVYETLARRAAQEMTRRWSDRVRRGSPLSDQVALALEISAEFWTEDRARARLLLEGGPSFGSEAHVQLVDQLAELMATRRGRRDPSLPSAEVAATVLVGLGIELGRVIVAGPRAKAAKITRGTVAFVRRTFG